MRSTEARLAADQSRFHRFDPRPRDAVIRVAQRFATSPTRAFQAWIDPTLAGRWLFATAGRPMTQVAIDARAGGAFHFSDDSGAAGGSGRYLEIIPHRRLVLELAGMGRRGSRVAVEFSRRRGGCLLSLTHSGLPSDHAGYAQARWEGMLYGLGLLLDSQAHEWLSATNPPARLRRVGPL